MRRAALWEVLAWAIFKMDGNNRPTTTTGLVYSPLNSHQDDKTRPYPRKTTEDWDLGAFGEPCNSDRYSGGHGLTLPEVMMGLRLNGLRDVSWSQTIKAGTAPVSCPHMREGHSCPTSLNERTPFTWLQWLACCPFQSLSWQSLWTKQIGTFLE